MASKGPLRGLGCILTWISCSNRQPFAAAVGSKASIAASELAAVGAMLGFATWNLVVAAEFESINYQVVGATLDLKCRHYFYLGSCVNRCPCPFGEVRSCCGIIIGCSCHNCWEALLATSIIGQPFSSSGCQREAVHKTFLIMYPHDNGQRALG